MKIKEILKDIFPEMSDTIVLNEVYFNTNEDVSDDFVKAFTNKHPDRYIPLGIYVNGCILKFFNNCIQ